MRSSISLCFTPDKINRIADRRALSLARIAAFMSSVILSLRVAKVPPETAASCGGN
jgi:hypothetical protein